MEFKDKVVIVTGGANGIGKCISEEFAKAGAHVCVIDLKENGYFQGDLADKITLEKFAEKVIAEFGHV
ncbi:MAG: SDR family NAD(P)-dependent oxidoreductase, partial [Lachnospiraceae bacterium]|nr:SDR family NAD(P)-dependent oxidoreductase [Lachnospiraceae bacterium]